MIKRMLTVVVLIVLLFAYAAVDALAKEMSVQVSQTQLRSTPAYYGAVVATVRYADRLTILETRGKWLRASNPKTKAAGWVHESALTGKTLALRSGAGSAPTRVSAGELSAAEKGFTEQIERKYRQDNKNIDFAWVDRMEKFEVTPQESAAFLKEGQVRPPEGGAL